MAAFAGVLATWIVQVKPYDPETKGIIERANGYLEGALLPGRRFTSPADFNDQLAVWLGKANTRLVRSAGARPVELLATDRAAFQTPTIADSGDIDDLVRGLAEYDQVFDVVFDDGRIPL